MKPVQTIFAMLVLSTFMAACGPAVKTGVRDKYKEKTQRVKSLAIVPFYSVSNFGLPDGVRDETIKVYEKRTQAWLTNKGYTVTSPEAFEQQLTEAGVWQAFQDGVSLTNSLQIYFEQDNVVRAEVSTLQTLAKQNKLPKLALLFGEVLYQSHAMCHVKAKSFTNYAASHTHEKAPKSFPKPCVISHFQAKLIDPNQGSTMWFNHGMSEFYVPAIEPAFILANINHAIAQTLGGENGLK